MNCTLRPAIAFAVLMCSLMLGRLSAQQKDNSEDDSELRPPVSKADLKIVDRATQILNSQSKWNQSNTRVCPVEAKTFSLYCALEKATYDIDGTFKHRGAAMQEARFAIDEIAPNHAKYHHRMKDFNNDPTTKFSDIQHVLQLTRTRIMKRLNEAAPESKH